MKLCTILLLCIIAYTNGTSIYKATGVPYSVTYDHRSISIDGERTLLLSGSIHYPRSTPAMWPGLLQQTKAAGINLVQIYVFWNLHEPTKGQYYFEDSANITQFIELCQQYELYVNLRIGPYVCAEWNYGGFPVWLRDIPDIVFRTYNKPFMAEMAEWTTYIVDKLKPYFASQGGPIILAQIENEYGNVESNYGEAGKQYASWAAQFATSLDIGVPWIMCQQNDQPLVINTCNGFYCDNWIPTHYSTFPNQPALWTENWPGWFQNWGQARPSRPVQDVLYSLVRWISAGGSHHNYYMWHGGTTFGRWTGGPFIVTSYDYDVQLNEYGYPHNPKFAQSVALHDILNANAATILNNEPVFTTLAPNSDARTFGTSLVFISNTGTSGNITVSWNNTKYTLKPWSVIILVDNKQIFDTSYVPSSANPNPNYMTPIQEAAISVAGYFTENSESGKDKAINATVPLEQISTTKDTSDYLWYIQTVTIPTGGVKLSFTDTYDMTYIYIDNVLIGSSQQTPDFSLNIPASFAGVHELQILSLTVGLVNYGAFLEQVKRGIVGSVMLGNTNITSGAWRHIPGLLGESKQIYAPSGLNSVSWTAGSTKNTPLTWYKAYVDLPSKQYNTDGPNIPPYALDMTGMTKGMVWVNGNMLGRYWLITGTGDCTPCDNWAGSYDPAKCREGCGEPSQQYYHVPADWLNPANNLVVFFEEQGGNPSSVQLVELQM